MTRGDRALAVLGGLAGGILTAAVGLPTAIALENRARKRARQRAARLDVDQLIQQETDRDHGWTPTTRTTRTTP